VKILDDPQIEHWKKLNTKKSKESLAKTVVKIDESYKLNKQ
jgi:hypothetical protein